jgi:hypothetical protein
VTCSLASASKPTRPPCNSAWRPPRRLSPPPTHPETGKRLQNKGAEPFSTLTVNGRISLYRCRYFAKDVGSFSPLDDWIDPLHHSISHGVREMACRLNQGSRCFAKATENLARTAQLRLSRETLRQLVIDEGKAVQAAEKKGQLLFDWDAGDCFIPDENGRPTAATRLYLGMDGVMAPMVTQTEKDKRRAKIKDKRKRRGRKCQPMPKARPGTDESFKEIKIVTFYDEPCEHRLVVLTRGDCQQAGKLLRRAAGLLALDKAQDKVGLVDGAEWIRNQIKLQSIPLDALGLDFYHLAEKVHKARRAVYGEEDAKDAQAPGNAWAARMLHLARHHSYVEFETAVWDWAYSFRGAKRKSAETLLNYISERDEMIRYQEFTEKGRQIGSGPTESMCKATTLRVKGRGKKWDADNVEAVMILEALDQSGVWEKYWNLSLTLAL